MTVKKLLVLLLCLCMAAAFWPTTAFAEGGGFDIRLGAAQLQGKQADRVFFGTYPQNDATGAVKDPIQWRVLSNGSDELFLLADQNLDAKQYHEEEEAVTWADSSLRKWLNDSFFKAAFSSGERNAIQKTELENANNPRYNTPGGVNTMDYVFCLSIAEAGSDDYGFENASRIAINTAYVVAVGDNMWAAGRPDVWWLRSPGSDDQSAAIIRETGEIQTDGRLVSLKNVAVRPAFNLDPAMILLTSYTEGGKEKPEADGGLTDMSAAGQRNTFKLTLKDERRSNFTASTTGRTGDVLTVSYQNAKTGTNEYISAIVKDADGNVTHYGRIMQLDGTVNGESGTVSVTLPNGFTEATGKLYLFNEQYNGEKMTDYASELKELPLTYTITYVLDGGTNPADAPTKYTYGIGVELPTPTKAEHRFDGWYTAQEGGEKVTAISATDTGDKTFYARWTANEYTITYVLDGGTNPADAPEKYTYGIGVELPTPTKAEHRFDGWYTAQEGGEKVTAISATDTGNKTFYARWTANEYTITYVLDGGTNPADAPEKYTYGIGVELPTPMKAEHRFDGWYTKREGGEKVTAISATDTGNKTFYARWTANEYTITYVLDGGTNPADAPEKYTYGIGVELPTPTKAEHRFDGWYTKREGSEKVMAIGPAEMGEKTFYARWAAVPVTYTVVYTDGVADEVVFADDIHLDLLAGDATPAYTGGTPTRAGYVFVGWKPAVVEKVSGNAVYAAQWKEKTGELPDTGALWWPVPMLTLLGVALVGGGIWYGVKKRQKD